MQSYKNIHPIVERFRITSNLHLCFFTETLLLMLVFVSITQTITIHEAIIHFLSSVFVISALRKASGFHHWISVQSVRQKKDVEGKIPARITIRTSVLFVRIIFCKHVGFNQKTLGNPNSIHHTAISTNTMMTTMMMLLVLCMYSCIVRHKLRLRTECRH